MVSTPQKSLRGVRTVDYEWHVQEDPSDEVKSKCNIAHALSQFADDVGIPDTLICDFASEQTGKYIEVIKLVC